MKAAPYPAPGESVFHRSYLLRRMAWCRTWRRRFLVLEVLAFLMMVAMVFEFFAIPTVITLVASSASLLLLASTIRRAQKHRADLRGWEHDARVLAALPRETRMALIFVEGLALRHRDKSRA